MDFSDPKQVEELCALVEQSRATPEKIAAARAGDVAMQRLIVDDLDICELKSSDIKWLAPLAAEGNWDVMCKIIVGATVMNFHSWAKACDIEALKERLISDCRKMDKGDLMGICLDEDLLMNKKCFFERLRKEKEAAYITTYALLCAHGSTEFGIKQNVSFALRLFKEAADLGDENAKEALEHAEFEDDWYLNV